MQSFKQAVESAGYSPPVNAQDLAARRRLPQPVSLKLLIAELTPDQIVFSTGEMEAGDVAGSAHLALLSTGWWAWRGHLYDNGFYYGDQYALALSFAGGNGYAEWNGHLDAGDSEDWKTHGWDQWIRDQWPSIKGGGFKWHLKADPSMGSDEILFFILKTIIGVGVVVGVIIGGAGAASSGDCKWKQDPEHGVWRCEW